MPEKPEGVPSNRNFEEVSLVPTSKRGKTGTGREVTPRSPSRSKDKDNTKEIVLQDIINCTTGFFKFYHKVRCWKKKGVWLNKEKAKTYSHLVEINKLSKNLFSPIKSGLEYIELRALRKATNVLDFLKHKIEGSPGTGDPELDKFNEISVRMVLQSYPNFRLKFADFIARNNYEIVDETTLKTAYADFITNIKDTLPKSKTLVAQLKEIDPSLFSTKPEGARGHLDLTTLEMEIQIKKELQMKSIIQDLLINIDNPHYVKNPVFDELTKYKNKKQLIIALEAMSINELEKLKLAIPSVWNVIKNQQEPLYSQFANFLLKKYIDNKNFHDIVGGPQDKREIENDYLEFIKTLKFEELSKLQTPQEKQEQGSGKLMGTKDLQQSKETLQKKVRQSFLEHLIHENSPILEKYKKTPPGNDAELFEKLEGDMYDIVKEYFQPKNPPDETPT